MESVMTVHRASVTWRDPAFLRALLIAAVLLVVLLAPIALGMDLVRVPSFDIVPDPLGALPF
jgi:hypothetical protein